VRVSSTALKVVAIEVAVEVILEEVIVVNKGKVILCIYVCVWARERERTN
jgi:hypothetical protein